MSQDIERISLTRGRKKNVKTPRNASIYHRKTLRKARQKQRKKAQQCANLSDNDEKTEELDMCDFTPLTLEEKEAIANIISFALEEKIGGGGKKGEEKDWEFSEEISFFFFFFPSPKGKGLDPENDEGQVEYKWKLINPPKERLQHLVFPFMFITQMNYRLLSGNGKCYYEVGVEDDGAMNGLCEKELIETLETIFLMAKQIDADIKILKIRQLF
ncbi:hypothetical protein RFI_10756, partial [Reticulomyxa filosa]